MLFLQTESLIKDNVEESLEIIYNSDEHEINSDEGEESLNEEEETEGEVSEHNEFNVKKSIEINDQQILINEIREELNLNNERLSNNLLTK